MKIRSFSLRLISACIMMCIVFLVAPAYAQETINVTQDQLELRSDPADDDENILGTLRANTPVTFTGTVSGKWYQITAPNGQTGWVHQSGVSRPKSLVKPTPTPKPTAAPKAEKTQTKPASRTVPKPVEKQPEKSSKSTTEPSKLDELNTLNKQYKAQLDEKDRRIAELSSQLDEVETKLADAGKTAADLEESRKSDASKLTEIETQIASLTETIQKKEDELLAQKAEFIALQDELNKQVTSQQTVSQQRMLLLVSLPLNLLGLLLLAYFGIRHIARKDERQADTLPHVTEHYSEIAPAAKPEEKPSKQPLPDAMRIQISKETDPELKDLDVIMTSSSAEEPGFQAETTPAQEEIEIEETVIDLGDTLPDEPAEQLAMDISEPGVIITEETIIVDEPIEIVQEDISEQESQITPITPELSNLTVAEEPALEEMPEEHEPIVSSAVDELEEIDETPVVSAPPVFEELEEIPELPESSIPEREVVEEVVEEIDLQEIGEDVELEFDDDDIEDTPIDAAAEGLAIDDDNMDALLEDTPPLEQTADMNELLETGELEEPTFEEVEIAGERFETVPDHGTQIIESEDEESYAEGDMEDDILLEANPGIIEEFEDEPETAARAIEPAPKAAPAAEDALEFDADEPVEPSFAKLRIHEEIDELLDMFDDAPVQRERPRQDAVSPGFAEPSPYLIEPEHEPEGLETTATEDAQLEPKYTIELMKVGRNRDHVLHILSKVQGLPKTAEELITNTPCVIARGANKQDAQNFQVLMKKFGADVRLTQH